MERQLHLMQQLDALTAKEVVLASQAEQVGALIDT